ncbi:chemosensory pili system protein ChpA (sensor histidine kinase/response regulator) [Gammaproteobacteria bacterium]
MNISSKAIERTPLGWVKGEIDQTLNRAQAALESYAENSSAVHVLQTCSEHLHEVTGILRIVEVQGGILLAEEMEQMVGALGAGQAQPSALEILMRAILLLPDYLERLQGGARDLPIALLPLLNELRVARGELSLTEEQIFFPDLTAIPVASSLAIPAGGAESITRRARSLFQSGLVAWYRNPDDLDAIKRLAQAMELLRAVATHPEAMRLWWVGAGLIEAIQDHGLDLAPARTLLGKLDRQIKRLIDGGEQGIISDPPVPLIRQVLYHIANCHSHGSLVEELREFFHLDEALPGKEDVAAIRNTLRGANRAVMVSVSTALREDLSGVMDSLDLFVRKGERNWAELQPIIERFHQIAGTLTIIDQEVAQKELLVVASNLARLMEGNQPEAEVEETLLNLAGHLVQVESILAGIGRSDSQTPGVEGIAQGFSMDERHLHQSVIQQALNSLVQAKESITNFSREPVQDALDAAQTALSEVSGVLTILNLDRPSHLATSCARIVKSLALFQEKKGAENTLDNLAVAIAALEFYLEEQLQGRTGESFLAQGEIVLATVMPATLVEEIQSTIVTTNVPEPSTTHLGFPATDLPDVEVAISDMETIGTTPWAAPALDIFDEGLETIFDAETTGTTQWAAPAQWEEEEHLGISIMLSDDPPSAPPFSAPESSTVTEQSSEVDPEIVEVFLEEIRDEMANLDRHLPRLRAALSSPEGFKGRENEESLRTTRRSFHTLKGSGRMVGATRLSELAWAIENLLNRVIDETVNASPVLLHALEDARLVLTALVEDFRTGKSTAQGAEEIAAQAWRLARAGLSSVVETLPVSAEECVVHAAEKQPSIDAAPVSDVITVIEEETEEEENITLSAMDPALLELFGAETQGHLEVLETALATCRNSGICVIDDALPRALHTLHGSARMAQIDGISVISRTLEQYIRAYAMAALPLDESSLPVIEEGVTLIRACLAALAGIKPSPDITSWQMLIAAAKEKLLAMEPVQQDVTTTATDGTIQLFLEEAMDTLKTGEQAVSQWQAQPSEIAALQSLRPLVKTLGSGAELIGTTAISALCHAIEDAIDQVVANPVLHSKPTAELFADAIERLWVMLENVREYQPISSPDDLCATLASRTRTMVPDHVQVPVVAVPVATTIAPSPQPARKEPERGELMMMFLAEGEDLMANLDNLLQQLSLTPNNVSLVGELRRTLHTLKGGARMVGIQAIADLAHALESMINQVVDGHLSASQRLFDLLQAAGDHLSEMLDQAREGVPVAAATDLHRHIENLVTQQLVPSDEEGVRDRKKGRIETEVITAALARPPVASQSEEAETGVEPSAQLDRRASSRVVQEHIRVAADLLNHLVNHAAEVSITRSRVDQQLAGLRHGLQEMAQTVTRLRDQWRKLEIETEVQIFRHHEKSGTIDFDPLELDRYSTLQQLSRSLMESVSDLASLHGLLSVSTRDAEILLLQQSRITKELQEGLMRTRMVPFAGLAQRLRRIVRQTAQELNIQAELQLVGADIELDRTVLDRVVAPLEHMLRNAVSHGLEPPAERRAVGKPEQGSITITLRREGQDILILSGDDGRGLNLAAIRRKAEERGLLVRGTQLSDTEVMQFILEPGFSTASQITQISGRGVGMDVVRNEVKLLGGTLHIDSEAGHGTTFTIRLPLTLAVSKALLINVQGDLFAIPLAAIRAVLQLSYDEASRLYEDSRPVLIRGGVEYQFVHAATLLNAPAPPSRLNPGEKMSVLLFGIGDLHTAVAVDHLLGAREIVVKSVGPQIGRVHEISGATILGDGRVVIILDMGALIRKNVALHGTLLPKQNLSEQFCKVEDKSGILVLVVDDSITVRKVTARLLERHNMRVLTARDGVDAVAMLQKHIPDLVVMDIEMPRMDGYELASYIRDEPRLRDIPIIMITSRTGTKHRERAAQVGVNHYLGKPYQETELLEVVHRLRPSRTGGTPQAFSSFRAGNFARPLRIIN